LVNSWADSKKIILCGEDQSIILITKPIKLQWKMDWHSRKMKLKNGSSFSLMDGIFTYGWQPITSLISRIQGNGWKLQGQELESFNKIISLILEKYDNDTLKAMD